MTGTLGQRSDGFPSSGPLRTALSVAQASHWTDSYRGPVISFRHFSDLGMSRDDTITITHANVMSNGARPLPSAMVSTPQPRVYPHPAVPSHHHLFQWHIFSENLELV